MARREDREAFVTLATNDTYALGCLVLASSLRRVGTTRQLAVMITPGVSQSIRDQLSRVFDLVNEVDLLDSRDPTNLQLLGRPDLNVTFTKFHCWRLTMYDKAVFLDADTLVLQNVDELFNREELSAAPDAGWPDCFNSGVFVFKPSEETYNAILQFALSQGSFDGGDQGLLNMFFRDWATKDISRHLPFTYNVVSQAFYSYLPAFKQFKSDVKIVHFIGATKPWHQPFNTSTGEVNVLPGTGHNQEFLQFWWTVFMEDIQSFLDPNLMSMLSTTSSQKVLDNHQPKPNLQSAFPFVPPTVENIFYEEKPDPPSENNNVTKPPLMDLEREYTKLEGNYAEEPMTALESSSVVYDAPKVVQTWTTHEDQNEVVNNNSNSSQNKHCEEHDHSLNNKVDHFEDQNPKDQSNDHSYKDSVNFQDQNPVDQSNDHSFKENVEFQDQNPQDHNQNCNLNDDHDDDCDQKELKDQNCNSEEKDCGENKENICNSEDEEGGLLGELAVLRISTGSQPGNELSSQERKLNWEKGQVDYLGVDAFDNIKKKLDASLTGPPEPQKPTTSPFSRQSPDSQPAKPTQNTQTAAESTNEQSVSTPALSDAPAQPTSTSAESVTTVAIKPSLQVAVSPTSAEPEKIESEKAPEVATPPQEAPAEAEALTGATATVPTEEPAQAEALAGATATVPTEAPAQAEALAGATATVPTEAPAQVAPAKAQSMATAPIEPPAQVAPATAPTEAPAQVAPATAPTEAPAQVAPATASTEAPAQKIAHATAPKLAQTSTSKVAPGVAPKPTSPTGTVPPKVATGVSPKPTSPTGIVPPKVAPKVAQSTESKGAATVESKVAPKVAPKVAIGSKFGPSVAPKPTSPTSPVGPTSATAPKVGLASGPKVGLGATPKPGPATFPKPTSPTSPTGTASKLPTAFGATGTSKEPATSKPTAPVKKVFNPFASKFGK